MSPQSVSADFVSVFTQGRSRNQASCTCGWDGRTRWLRAQAVNDAHMHAAGGCQPGWPLLINEERDPVRHTKRAVASLLVFSAMFGAALYFSTGAKADPGVGCETIHWGFLGSQLRTICDGPKNPDGGWLRARVIWTPAHYVPFRTSCGTYSCSSTGGYYVDDQVFAKESYYVLPDTVLPDEPGWLPAGTDVLR